MVSIAKHELLQVQMPNKTDPAVTFRSEVLKSIDIHELDYQFQVGYNQNVLQIDEFQRSDGG